MVFHPLTVHHEQVPSGFRFSPRLPSQNRKSGGQYVLDLDPLPSARSYAIPFSMWDSSLNSPSRVIVVLMRVLWDYVPA
jgi:hypothetical protein